MTNLYWSWQIRPPGRCWQK